jgi:hypothetical protein
MMFDVLGFRYDLATSEPEAFRRRHHMFRPTS